MGKSIQILSVLLLLTLASPVRAQTPARCGVDIDGPSEIDVGAPLRLKAKISGVNDITRPEFKWAVSVGTIMAGQGTEEITVDTFGLGGQVLTATAWLSGVRPGCKGAASITTSVKAQALSCCEVFDEFGDIKLEDEKARLDNFAIHVSNQDTLIGYILMSAGKVTFENEAAEHLADAKSYIVDVRRVDRNRIVTVDCGFSQDLNIRLYAVPPGVRLPECSNSEVPFSEVKFTKPRPKPAKKQHSKKALFASFAHEFWFCH